MMQRELRELVDDEKFKTARAMAAVLCRSYSVFLRQLLVESSRAVIGSCLSVSRRALSKLFSTRTLLSLNRAGQHTWKCGRKQCRRVEKRGIGSSWLSREIHRGVVVSFVATGKQSSRQRKQTATNSFHNNISLNHLTLS